MQRPKHTPHDSQHARRYPPPVFCKHDVASCRQGRSRMRSMRVWLIFHCQTEQVSGAQNMRQGGQDCQVVPSQMMLPLLLPPPLALVPGTGVLQSCISVIPWEGGRGRGGVEERG